MVEKTIKGTIENWSKLKAGFKVDGETPYVSSSVKLMDDKEWYMFFGDKPKDIEALKQNAPVGSEIEFVQWQKEGDQYWNFKKESLKVLSKGDGTQPQQSNNSGNASGTSEKPEIPGMTEAKWNLKELRKHRMQAMNNCVALAVQGKLKIDEMASQASMMVGFVYAQMDNPIEQENVQDEKPKEVSEGK